MDAELNQDLEAMGWRMNERLSTTIQGLYNRFELKSSLCRMESRLVETMHDMQIELLRAFAVASEDQTIQLRRR
jgi:hypothetical protein